MTKTPNMIQVFRQGAYLKFPEGSYLPSGEYESFLPVPMRPQQCGTDWVRTWHFRKGLDLSSRFGRLAVSGIRGGFSYGAKVDIQGEVDGQTVNWVAKGVRPGATKVVDETSDLLLFQHSFRKVQVAVGLRPIGHVLFTDLTGYVLPYLLPTGIWGTASM